MVVSVDSVVFKLLEQYRRANKTCQETCQVGKLLVSHPYEEDAISRLSLYTDSFQLSIFNQHFKNEVTPWIPLTPTFYST